MAYSSPLRVGLIGCGEVSQVVHIPTLGFMSDFFQINYLCDVSRKALAHCSSKVVGSDRPKTTTNAKELCSSPDVDIVFVASSDEFHALHIITALEHNKFCFAEKPMALNMRDADAIIAAEAKSTGKVMVGYMRRYAGAFEDAVKEVGGIDKILYARVRDIIGPNSTFISQSGTFPKKFTDFEQKDTDELLSRQKDIIHTALAEECGIQVSRESTATWRKLGSSHDLSAMREILGMPQSVIGTSLGLPLWSALFKYSGFSCTYESGVDKIARFDACIEIFSAEKTVTVTWNTPYVKGLATNMLIKENIGDDGAYRESTVRKTFEDPYTREMKVLYDFVKNGKPVKTTAADAKEDIKLFQMLVKAQE